MKLPPPPRNLPPRLTADQLAIADLPFNPRKPASIYNPIWQRAWPYPVGTLIYFIDTRFAPSPEAIYIGRVRYYNPAREIDHSCVTTPGRDTMTLSVHEKGSHIVSPEDCAPRTKAGWRSLLGRIMIRQQDKAAQAIADAKESIASAVEWLALSDALAKKLYKQSRRKSGITKTPKTKTT